MVSYPDFPLKLTHAGLVVEVHVKDGGGTIKTNFERPDRPLSSDFLYTTAFPEGQRRCYCNNCDWLGTEEGLGNDLANTPDLTDRLEPGEEVPVGECPSCGCLCYLEAKNDFEEAMKNHDGYCGALDALESLILAHACAGISIGTDEYLVGVKTALDAIIHAFE